MYKVLVVDDDRTCLSILKANLQKWNYEVTTANHASDALCRLRAKPYDIVLSDVHMPNMDGFELLRHINQEFRLPVILISSDSQAEVMIKGLQNGAQFFLVKPIVAEDVKNIWQFSEWWKRTIINRGSPIGIGRTSQENAEGNIAISSDNISSARTKKLVWTPVLHTRFVEALLVLGYHKALPRRILEVMNVPELRREQVASHLQKYRQFVDSILDGSAEIDGSHWINLNCYSTVVSGNPHLMLINQLRSEQRSGQLAAAYRSGANNINGGQQGIVQQDISTGILLDANQFGNTSAVNRHLRGCRQMTNQILFNGHNINGGEFGNTSASNEHLLGAGKMTVPNHFNGQNIDGGQQLGPGGMTNPKRWSSNEVPAPDNSFVGQNLIQGKDGENPWGMHVAIAKDKDVSVANMIGDDDNDVNS